VIDTAISNCPSLKITRILPVSHPSMPDSAPSYFELRHVTPEFYSGYEIPAYLSEVLPLEKDARILDIGCGFGQFLAALTRRGYTQCRGIDATDDAVRVCRERGLNVDLTDDITGFCSAHPAEFDLIVMSHVLEHLPKDAVVPTSRAIRGSLRPNGRFCVMVPNAQSATGSYWAFEDFTHHTLYTSGSLYFVLRAAGFRNIDFIDTECVAGLPAWKRLLKRTFLRLYTLNRRIWNRVTNSAFHQPSPMIFSFEIKAIAS
jgi:SAM-dependent methyltransferase